MVSKLLKIPTLLWLLWEFRKRWINKGRRKACKEFEKTLETYEDTIVRQGKLNATIIKNFIKWSNKISRKEVSEFNRELQRYQELNKQLEITIKATDSILSRGVFEGSRQRRVVEEMQRVSGRSYSHYDEFKKLKDDLGDVKRDIRKTNRKVKTKKRQKK